MARAGTWQETFEDGKQAGFEFSFALVDDDGAAFDVEGHGRVESKGPRTSIGAAARAAAQGVTLNFSMAGRSVGPNRCLELLSSDGL